MEVTMTCHHVRGELWGRIVNPYTNSMIAQGPLPEMVKLIEREGYTVSRACDIWVP